MATVSTTTARTFPRTGRGERRGGDEKGRQTERNQRRQAMNAGEGDLGVLSTLLYA